MYIASPRAILKAIRAGVGFGSGTETSLTLEIKEFRYYETRMEESEEDGGCLAVVAQWQCTGGSIKKCPGFNSRRLLAFSLSLSKLLYL